MKKVVNKIWSAVTTIILVALILVVAAMYVPKLFGAEPMIVLSGSMEPTYHVGSLLYVEEADADEIEVGDAITFYISEDTLVTHRVVAINEDGTYTTKGDANDENDGGSVAYSDIVGKPVFNIPKLGYLADKLTSTGGKIIYGTAVAVVLILMFLGDVLFGEDKKEKEKAIEKKKEEKEADHGSEDESKN